MDLEILGNNSVGVISYCLLFTDVFQYLTDVDVNTTVNDDLISEVCPIVIILCTCSHIDCMHKLCLMNVLHIFLEIQDLKLHLKLKAL